MGNKNLDRRWILRLYFQHLVRYCKPILGALRTFITEDFGSKARKREEQVKACMCVWVWVRVIDGRAFPSTSYIWKSEGSRWNLQSLPEPQLSWTSFLLFPQTFFNHVPNDLLSFNYQFNFDPNRCGRSGKKGHFSVDGLVNIFLLHNHWWNVRCLLWSNVGTPIIFQTLTFLKFWHQIPMMTKNLFVQILYNKI